MNIIIKIFKYQELLRINKVLLLLNVKGDPLVNPKKGKLDKNLNSGSISEE